MGRRRGAMRGVTATVIALGTAVLLTPASATADPATDGFWYFDAFHIQEAHDAGLTGKGVTIGVIDTPIDLDVPTLRGADIEVQESICYQPDGEYIPATSTDLTVAAHGTNVVSYLVGSGQGYPGQTGVKGILPDARIIYTSHGTADADGVIRCTDAKDGLPVSPLAQGINAAIDANADIISISGSDDPHPDAVTALTRALARGIVVIAALGNEEFDFEGGFPSGSNGVVGVQAIDSAAQVRSVGQTGVDLDVLGPGVDVVWQGGDEWSQQTYATGTSIATPVIAGFLGLVAQKYPEATGNQLIQTLIRNTGTEDHELIYDPGLNQGYGVASATHMLRVDPTQYDDVNPLIVPGDDQTPTAEEIAAAADEPETTDPTGTSDPSESTGVPLWVIVGAGVLLVIAIVVVISVIAVRKNRGATRHGQV